MTSTRARREQFSPRAIIVYGDQISDIRQRAWTREVDNISRDYDAANAGDQPRIQWCVEHRQLSTYCDDDRPMGNLTTPCRVVTAIVVPIEEDA